MGKEDGKEIPNPKGISYEQPPESKPVVSQQKPETVSEISHEAAPETHTLYHEEVVNAENEERPVDFSKISPNYLTDLQDVAATSAQDDLYLLHHETLVENYKKYTKTHTDPLNAPDDKRKLYEDVVKEDVVFSMNTRPYGHYLDDSGFGNEAKYPLTIFEELGRAVIERMEAVGDIEEFVLGGEDLKEVGHGHLGGIAHTKRMRNVLGIIGRDYKKHIKPFLHPVGTKGKWIIDIPFIRYGGATKQEDVYFSVDGKTKEERKMDKAADEVARNNINSRKFGVHEWDNLSEIQDNEARFIAMPADRFLVLAGNPTEEDWNDQSGFRRGDQGRHQKWRSGKKKGQYKHLSTVDFFKQRILDGETMGTIELTYDVLHNLIYNHEGRHRARAMLELFREGLVDSPNVPVVLKVSGTTSKYGQEQEKEYQGGGVYGTGNMSGLAEDEVLYNRVMGDGWSESKNINDRVFHYGEHHWRHKGIFSGNAGGADPMNEKESMKQAELHYMRLLEDTHNKAKSYFGRGGHRFDDMITEWQDETVFGGSIASGKSQWISIAVDPKKGTGGLGSPLNFTEYDVLNLTGNVTTKEGQEDFENSLDKWTKMLENYPELKKKHEETGEKEIQERNYKRGDDWRHGKYRVLYHGGTLRNTINLMRARNITKPLKYKNIDQKRRNITNETIYNFFSTTLSPSVAMDTLLPFAQGGVTLEINSSLASKLHERHDVTGKRSGAKYDKKWKEDSKRLDELEEKKNVAGKPLTDEEMEEYSDLKYGGTMGVLGIAKRPSGKRRTHRFLKPVKYTTEPTMTLGMNPEPEVRKLEQVDTDYKANYESELEVRLDLGLETKSGYKDEFGDDVGSGDWGLYEGVIMNMSSDDFVENHFEELGMGDLYRKLRGDRRLMPFMSGYQDMQDFLFDTEITVGDLPTESTAMYKRWIKEGDDEYGHWAGELTKKISLFEALNLALDESFDTWNRQKSEYDYDRKTHQSTRKNRKEIRIRYNFINSTGGYDVLEDDEHGNKDVHYKTYRDWRDKRR